MLMWAIIIPLSLGLFIAGCNDDEECPTVDYTTLDASIVSAQALRHGDAGPLASDGKPQPDGVIDVSDAVVIMERVVGFSRW